MSAIRPKRTLNNHSSVPALGRSKSHSPDNRRTRRPPVDNLPLRAESRRSRLLRMDSFHRRKAEPDRQIAERRIRHPPRGHYSPKFDLYGHVHVGRRNCTLRSALLDRSDLGFRGERSVHGALVGDLHKPSALAFVEVPRKRDRAIDPIEHPFLGIAVQHSPRRRSSSGSAAPSRCPAEGPSAQHRAAVSSRCRRRARRAKDRKVRARCRARPPRQARRQ